MAYEFQEYPKWVKDAKGNDVVVKSKEEEAEVAAKPSAPAQAPAAKK